MMKEQNLKLLKKYYEEKKMNLSAYNNLVSLRYGEKQKNKKERCKIEQKEKISIVVPTYNRKEQLTECVESILRQTYQNFEILILDDSSNKDTYNIYNNHHDKRIKYFFNEKNLGIGLNRQKGYNNTKGEYIIFCDDDDYFIDDQYFEKTISIFKDNNINMICSDSIMHYETEDIYELNPINIKGTIDAKKYLENFHFNYSKPNSTFCAIFRKKVLEKAKFEKMEMMNDTCIYLRALTIEGKCYFNNNIIGVYRIHGCNVTYNATAKFTIDNFEEKKYILNCIENNTFDKKKWFEKQISITARHFFNGKEKRITEVNKVLQWIKKNVSIKIYFKYLIVSILRGFSK